jgi:N-acetyl sugar amidotransferase
MSKEYQVCTSCVMDTSDSEIVFDDKGECNHCKRYRKFVWDRVFSGREGQDLLEAAFDKVRRNGKGKEFDCILGLSGGCDSTYVAYLAKQHNLRPYLVSFNNGYDPAITTRNCQRIAAYLKTDLHTWSVDYWEFKQLQLAYLMSGCVNIEVLSDHAIWAVLYRSAAKLGLRYILSGNNVVTEAIIPASWGYDSKDLVNILDIYKKHGNGTPLKTFPILDSWQLLRYHYLNRVQIVPPLNYVQYIKEDAKKLFTKEFGWEDYGPKHAESIITRFYQFYILPKRTGIDKRRAHLSCLVLSNQMKRSEALEELKKDAYDSKTFSDDYNFVLNYLGITGPELEKFIALPIKSNWEYKTDITPELGKKVWMLMPVQLRKTLKLESLGG